ncbi:MAG: outer membrane beta-barrel domain-containing protein [Bdellovibrionales bacterium]|nr:outer membrane beta-barrel domain-containing protein [Bdellovibrionales bacterium]
MKKYQFILLFLSFFSFADFDQLGKKGNFLKAPIKNDLVVVQEKWLDRKFLSEWNIGVSPFLSDFYYMNSYSLDLSYRFFFNDNLSFHLKYSYFLNPLNKEGEKELFSLGRVPLEIKYSPKNYYVLGMDFYPFYGKSVLFNYLLYFDLYFSLGIGKIEIFQLNRSTFLFSGAFGMVFWWNKKFNTRLELEGLNYKYQIPDPSLWDVNEEFSYQLRLSVGILI